jgi:DNA (cytosine-5)-methyltransferase 1
LPAPLDKKMRLSDILLENNVAKEIEHKQTQQIDLFGETHYKKNMSLSNNNNGFNDYFLFNDLRNGHSTIHSWDILNTTDRQKAICYFLLKNRRKSLYGKLDGNPLALAHFKTFDNTITQEELDELVAMDILRKEEYLFKINSLDNFILSEEEHAILVCAVDSLLVIDDVKSNVFVKRQNLAIKKIIDALLEKGVIECVEIRYDFKNTKISTGLFGVNRIFLPSSNIFPTLVASDSNDYITLKEIKANNEADYKRKFINDIYKKNEYRKITKEEACLIQGFPKNFTLPENRSRWIKLLGNSVSVPVIQFLVNAILNTGITKETN